jgi:hypothetical protein
MGVAVVETYMDRARGVWKAGGRFGLAMLWFRALADSLRNGPAERVSPAASWRRGGNWGRDIELVRRRLLRSPIFAATTLGTLTVGVTLRLSPGRAGGFMIGAARSGLGSLRGPMKT